MSARRRRRSYVAALRAPIAIALAALAMVLAGPSAALGASTRSIPAVTFIPSLALVPEFSAAGLGQGTMLTATLELGGNEYQGSVAPISELRLQLPAGVGATTAGFATCSAATLEELGPSACPRGSRAGGDGRALAYVTFGGERAQEEAEVSSYFAPGGGLDVFIDGHSPVSLEMLAEGALVGNVLTLSFPLVPSVPGASFASIAALTLPLGTARVEHGASVYSLTMPEECPEGGFVWSAEVFFSHYAFESYERLYGEPLRATAETPCPALSSGESALPGTEGIITAPPNKQCVSRRDFVIHVQQIKGLKYRRVGVDVDGRSVAVVKGARFHARVDLRGLPKGRYTVRITVLTTTGRQITGTRAYHTCAAKPLPGGRPRL
ncbi:MAG: hypothetical protein ACLP1Q_15455 [Solirubrobacteraceae bacterium]